MDGGWSGEKVRVLVAATKSGSWDGIFQMAAFHPSSHKASGLNNVPGDLVFFPPPMLVGIYGWQMHDLPCGAPLPPNEKAWRILLSLSHQFLSVSWRVMATVINSNKGHEKMSPSFHKRLLPRYRDFALHSYRSYRVVRSRMARRQTLKPCVARWTLIDNF